MTTDPSDLVRLSARRVGNTPAGDGIYRFEAAPVAALPDTTAWRCTSCRWWEAIPEFAIDPSGRHGMCLLAELQDATHEPAQPKRFLASDGMATAADFGCVSWQTAFVPADEAWLQGAQSEDWRFPGVGSGERGPVPLVNGLSRPGGPVSTFVAPEGHPEAAPAWSCAACRWYLAPAVGDTAAGRGTCSIVAKTDLIPPGDDPCVFLLAFAGEDGLEVAADFGCAMWDDERYAVLPERRWFDEG